MKKKVLLMITCLMTVISLAACGKPQQMQADSVLAETATEVSDSEDLQHLEADGETADSGKNDVSQTDSQSKGNIAGEEEKNEDTGSETINSASSEDSNSQDLNSQNQSSRDSDSQVSNSQKTGESQNHNDGQDSQKENAAANEADSANAAGEGAENVAAPAAETGTPVANHGELFVKGTDLVDKNGKPYQIKGVSTHGIAWFPDYVNKEAFRTMRDEWGINCVRLAMYSAEGNGYCTGGNQSQLKQLVMDGVEYATELGLYVIIDWHVLGDQDPNVHKDTAKEFFREMSQKYAGYDNVIYEICNEPNGGTNWASVKKYAEEVIPIIKANNSDAIIIVGTPTWSQDVDQAAADPIKGYSNIMYTIHFYADTHRDSLRQKMVSAMNAGIPVFCTEFGICDASGSGANNKSEGEKWIATMDANNVSYCIWNLSNKSETSALISAGCSKKSGWTMDDLSDSGKWYVGILNNGVTPGTTPAVYEESNSSGGQGNNGNPNQNSNGNADNQNANGNSGFNQNGSNNNAVTASSANTEVTISSQNSWESGYLTNYQYTVIIKNTGNTTVKDWNITLDFGTNVSVDQSWNGTFEPKGSRVIVTPVDYNKEISAGSSVEFGFIISSSSSVESPKVTIN